MIGDKLGRFAYHPDLPATKKKGTAGPSIVDKRGTVLRNMRSWESDWMDIRDVREPLDIKAALKKVSPNSCASLLSVAFVSLIPRHFALFIYWLFRFPTRRRFGTNIS